MGTIGILCAMNVEAALLRENMTNLQPELSAAGLSVTRGTLCGKPVALTVCGIGKVHAAMAAQLLIDRCGAELLINTGIAGGLGEGLKTLDLVAAERLVEHDFDMTAIGEPKGYVPGLSREGEVLYVPASPRVLEVFRRVAGEFPGHRFLTGTIASGDMFLADPDYKRSLRREFGAVAGEMEGAAVARVAAANGADCFVLRAISDLADGDAAMTYDTFEKQAADLSGHVLMKLLTNL